MEGKKEGRSEITVDKDSDRNKLDNQIFEARRQFVLEATALLSRGEIGKAREILMKEVERTEDDIMSLEGHLEEVKKMLDPIRFR